MAFQKRLELGQPHLDGDPAIAGKHGWVRFERILQGRRLADAGLHEKSRGPADSSIEPARKFEPRSCGPPAYGAPANESMVAPSRARAPQAVKSRPGPGDLPAGRRSPGPRPRQRPATDGSYRDRGS